MNRINFKQTGGFPLDANVLDFMQNAYSLLNTIGELAGELSILRGCRVVGNTVSDGVVFIAGEVLPFKQSTGHRVIIKEERTAMQFEDGNSKEVEITRYATLGAGSISWSWEDFVRIDTIREIQRKVVPTGLISMWSGEARDVPIGWALCDGKNGTPDLRERFVVGSGGSYKVGDTGGKDMQNLAIENMPSHSHRASTGTSGSHTHAYNDIYYSESGGSVNLPSKRGSGSTDYDNGGYQIARTTDWAGAHTHSINVESTGGGKGFDNRPRFYSLAFIIFKG